MDHHCRWLNNCVGFENRKFFMLVLLYSFVLCIICLVFSIYPIFIFSKEIYNGNFTVLWNLIVICIGYLFLFVFFFIMICFLKYHFDLIQKNKTTLEVMDEFRGNIPNYHYNLGNDFNWKFVFGKNKYLWYFPVNDLMGDGTVFVRKSKYANKDNIYESYVTKEEYYEDSQIAENFIKKGKIKKEFEEEVKIY